MRQVEDTRNADWDARTAEYEKELQSSEAHKKKWEAALSAAINSGAQAPEMPVEAHEPEMPTRRRILIGDATTEKIAHLLSRVQAAYSASGTSSQAGWAVSISTAVLAPTAPSGWRLMAAERIVSTASSMMRLSTYRTAQCRCWVECSQTVSNSMLLSGDDDGLLSRLIFAWPEMVRSRRPTRFADEQPLIDALQRLATLDFDRDENGSNQPRIVRLENQKRRR